MCENLSVRYIKAVLGLKLLPQAVVKDDIISGGSCLFTGVAKKASFLTR